jgi:hypothetical protein
VPAPLLEALYLPPTDALYLSTKKRREKHMKIREYFENAKGFGVSATADSAGQVDIALYARPHMMDDETVAFIMPDRLTHHNLQSNPKAAYLFLEQDRAGGQKRFTGKRLFLSKIKEEKDTELLYSIRRKQYEDEEEEGRYLVYFKVDKVIPLVGEGNP